ncbi:MAG TPA: sugar ABC transporter permease [Propionicimonas sp.]|jgi:multiple sugar transport system permease protein
MAAAQAPTASPQQGRTRSGAAGRRPRGGLRRRGNRAAYAYIAGALVYLIVFVLYPIGRATWISLTKTSLLTPTTNEFVGLGNFQGLIDSGTIQHTLWLTTIFVVAVSVVSMLAGVGSALLIEGLVTGKATARTLLALPWTIPSVVIALLFDLILNQRVGLANNLLAAVGQGPVGWLTEPSLALVSVIGVTVWNLFPFVMLVTMAALQTVPAEIYDSASVDGAGTWAMATRITLPYIAPTLQVVSLFLIIWSFQQFQVLWILTQGGPVNGTDVVSIELYRTAFLFNDLGRASAIGVVALIPSVLITLFYFRVANPMEVR